MNILVNTTVVIPGYTLVEQLYAGSRTVVYRGIREVDKQAVVVKLLQREYPTFSELLQFRNQYTITKNLDSPGIIQPYSLEPYRNSYALVMEDFGGTSLRDYVQNQPLALTEFLLIALQLTDILNYLYHHQIIHKDIKPANILIHPQTKQVKIIDFSIASLLPKETQEIKNPNVLEGTLAYLAPEQTGRMNRSIDYRVDFYALGVTFFELLTGQLPFTSRDPMELVHCHIAKEPDQFTNEQSVPQVLADIVMKLMAKNAEDRYQSALGLRHDLEICLNQLKATGKIQVFAIGQRDVCYRFLIPEKLYGRETEVQQLLAAFERVSHFNSELMLIAGFSGIGKTAVVNEVHKPIVKQRGYFIKGKFDQFNRNIPFSAFVQAFRDLMMQLLTESDQQLQQWKTKILEAVGENGQVITKVIPELEKIIGQQLPAPELFGIAAQNRFNFIFQKFIQLFTTKEHPLVLFLDDLQWADSASLKLMQLLISESNSKYLFLIGAYRYNEVSAVHPLMFTLEEIIKAKAKINTIDLVPLSYESLNQLISDTLNCDSEIAQPLTQLVYQKTQGIPFFSTQFLKTLYENRLIKFDSERGNWQCNIAEIRELALSDNVVELMVLQLQKLPLSTQNVLKLAACIGNQFDLATLAIVSSLSEKETAACLWKAVQEGLISPQSEVYKFYLDQEHQEITSENSEIVAYKFLHDQVQQAAYSLIPDDEKQKTHYQIGQLLLERISPEARVDHIFELVNQLNYGISLITEQTARDELAQLNLIACRKAKAATAYQAAREYAAVGLSLLGEQSWLSQYKMTLSLHELAAEVASLCGDFEAMEQLVNIVIAQVHSLLEQVNVYQIRIQSHLCQNKLAEAIAIAQQILQQLGVTFTESPTLTDIQQEIREIKELIADRKIEDFVHLSVMTDRSKLAIVQIANCIIPAAYNFGSPLFPLLILLSVKISIQYGNISASALSYISYGIILCNLLQDVDTAVQFGQLALKVVSKLDDKATRPEVLLVLGCFILHRKNHIKETLPLLGEGYVTSLEVGNMKFAGYSANTFCNNSFWCGQPLITLEQHTRAYCNELVQLNQLTIAHYCRCCWQSTLNLLGFAEHPSILSGEAMEEAESLTRLLFVNDLTELHVFYSYKLTLCFLFGEIEQAKNHAVEGRRYLMGGGCAGTAGEAVFYFYDSLIALAQLNPNSDEASEVLQRVAQNQTQLQQHWAHYAPMNYQHKFDLVEAEKYRVLGKKYEAGDYYDQAIAGAKANEHIQEEAIANELAAKFYLDWGNEKVAQAYMQEAYYCYARWGAKAKIDDLEKRYPQLLVPILQQQKLSFNPLDAISTISSTSTQKLGHANSSSSSSNISDTLDFASVLKAAQVISSNIQLDELIISLTKIILENAGAKRCVLILPQKDKWQVRAITSISSKDNLTTTVLNSQLLDDCQDVPVKLIQYVKRTREPLVIDNCQTEISGMMIGNYMLRYQPKSALCTPILNQGQLVGILYLENNLTQGVFTSDRLIVINFLCTQAAISLENARLYQQVHQALQDLQRAQLQIVQSEKMSALGNLVAGVAHEMNNPLSFISASLEQAKPTVADLIEHLKLYQTSFPNPSDEILNHAKEIDLDYGLEDLPKIINSMTTASDRLQNISTSLRTFSRADHDYKVAFPLHEGIDSTILILKHRLKANKNRPAIEVVTDYGDFPQVECFPGQLNQVFMNLLANAIDALEESNQGRSYEEIKATQNCITIRTVLQDNYVKISISDNGVGMTAEVKQRVFDHLFTTKSVGKGTGLGLAIAHQIVVEKHGGQITVDSAIGQGTQFVIFLPVSSF